MFKSTLLHVNLSHIVFSASHDDAVVALVEVRCRSVDIVESDRAQVAISAPLGLLRVRDDEAVDVVTPHPMAEVHQFVVRHLGFIHASDGRMIQFVPRVDQ